MRQEYHLNCTECEFERIVEVDDIYTVLEQEEQHQETTSDAHLVEFKLLQ